MISRSSTILGITMADRTFWFAEVSVSPGKSSVGKTAVLHLPPDVPLEKPEAVGKAISVFLRKQGIRCSQAVVGLPAKQLIAMEHETPPAGAEEVKGVLRMAAERLAVSESQETVFDFVGNVNTGRAGRVLMVGSLQQHVDRLESIVDAAELEIEGVTASTLGLLQCAGDVPGILVLHRTGAELLWRKQNSVRMLKHLNVPSQGDGPNLAMFASDLKRTVSLAPSEGIASKGILLWDGIGLSKDQIAELSEKAGVPLQVADGFSPLGLGGASNTPGLFAQAASIALAAGTTEGLPLNFLKTKLAPPKETRVSQPVLISGSAVALIILAMIFMFGFNRYKDSQYNALVQEISKKKPEIDKAKKNFEDYNYVKGFFNEGRPQTLQCLFAITEILAHNGQGGQPDPNIWLSKINIKEDNKGLFIISINGRAATRSLADNLINALQTKKWDEKSKPIFSNVKLERTNLVQGVFEFQISCNYNEKTNTSPEK